jgi:hypothetical protein
LFFSISRLTGPYTVEPQPQPSPLSTRNFRVRHQWPSYISQFWTSQSDLPYRARGRARSWMLLAHWRIARIISQILAAGPRCICWHARRKPHGIVWNQATREVLYLHRPGLYSGPGLLLVQLTNSIVLCRFGVLGHLPFPLSRFPSSLVAITL